MNAISKRLFSWLIVAAMVLSMVPALNLSNFAVETKAAAGDPNITDADIITKMTKGNTIDNSNAAIDAHVNAHTCPMCNGTDITWTEVTSATTFPVSGNGKHLVVSGDITTSTKTFINATSSTTCVALKSDANVVCRKIYVDGSAAVLNIMGTGKLHCDNTDSTGTNSLLDIQKGEVNLYGGNYTHTIKGTVGQAAITLANNASAKCNIYAGATIGPDAVNQEVPAVNVYQKNGELNMYGGTIRNGVAMNNIWSGSIASGNVNVVKGTFNMYGGTIKDGTYKTGQANSVGNLYVYSGNSTFNMYGGAIEGGKGYGASAVGSIYAYSSKVNILGGTVSGGQNDHASNGRGGNIDGTSGTITIGGTALIYGGKGTSQGSNIYQASGQTVNITGGTIVGDIYGATKITLSGSPQILKTYNSTNAAAGVTLADGAKLDINGLTAGAKICVSGEVGTTITDAYTGSVDVEACFSHYDDGKTVKKQADNTLKIVEGTEEPESGAVLVAANGTETLSNDVLNDWKTNNYAYIKLYENLDLAMDGESIVIDLAGNDLTVTGNGNVSAFDTANDTYDAAACGTITNNGEVTFTEGVPAPNGGRYVTVVKNNTATAHRLDIKLTSVNLRTAAAGVYYVAQYTCDSVLADAVKSYGVIVSVDNMPGADYTNDGTDINEYTVAKAAFQSGVKATSGAIFGIMKESREAADNDRYARMPIYANAYIDLGNGPIVADIVNTGKKVGDAGFNGVALSLYDVMFKLDEIYKDRDEATRKQLDDFYNTWKEDGMDWDFENIGKPVKIESKYTKKLEFDAGTTNAYCPVCDKKVTWTPVDGSARVVNKAANHYYLTNDVTYGLTGTSTEINNQLCFFSPGNGDYSVCFHLNGFNFTGDDARFIYGGTSVTNIMGSGTVTGSRHKSDWYPSGSTIQINTTGANGAINLYGGTWTQAEDAPKVGDSVIYIDVNGGTVNVYEDAVVEANSNGKAIAVASPGKSRDAILGIYGTVKGDVFMTGVDKTQLQTSYVTVDSGVIDGTLNINGINTVTVSGAAKIKSLDMEETSLLTLGELEDGAEITVKNHGIFTEPSDNAAASCGYFKPADPYEMIVVKDKALQHKPDYTSKLSVDADGKAYCPVCKDVVTWTPVDGSARVVATGTSHYYLTKNVTYTAATEDELCFFSPGNGSHIVCFHLNGYNFTATNTRFVFGGTSVANILGSGIVTGVRNNKDWNPYGSTVQLNTTGANGAINLYGGIWKQGDNGKFVASDHVISISDNGGAVNIFEDATVEANDNGMAIYVSTSNKRNSNLGIYGATVTGDITVAAPSNESYHASLILDDATVTGAVTVNAGNDVSMSGLINIDKLTLAQGAIADFVDLKDGTDITVSADGIFSGVMADADAWLKYLTCADEGDWIVVRDKQFCQEAKREISAATDADMQALNATYANKTVKYGEMHDHSSATLRADGQNSLAEWKAEMDRLGMDFANIVDHGQSQHMYHQDWDPTYFIGGSEPGTSITDSKAMRRSPHYNLLFSDPKDLEELILKWNTKYQISYSKAEDSKFTEGLGGFLFDYPNFKTAEFGELAKDAYEMGGLFVLVHPKYDSYIYSNDPNDYFFADYTGFEITTGSGGNMMYKDNNEAYETWVDLLEMGKKIWATSGSDKHRMPNLTALTTMYTDADHADTYMEHMRAGNFAPGWVGIRMNVGTTAMGGETSFADQRLQFSVGDIYNSGKTDAYNTAPAYVEGHTYRVELYDDGGLLMSSNIDPTRTNYFAIDCDATAKFYRVVVWDETDNERIGVGNPIWNTAPVEG